jgi:hypothetical protein
MRSLLIAALAALCGCSASASETSLASPYAPTLQCDVSVTPSRHGVRFEASALDHAGASGEYEFVIRKHDRAGDSNIVQAGEFELAPGERLVLGEAEFSLERSGRYEARLELRDDDVLMCSAEATR